MDAGNSPTVRKLKFIILLDFLSAIDWGSLPPPQSYPVQHPPELLLGDTISAQMFMVSQSQDVVQLVVHAVSLCQGLVVFFL